MLVRSILFIILFLLPEEGLHAQIKKDNVHIFLYSGYCQKHLHWSIAGNLSGENPNIYSELKWKSVAGPVTGFKTSWMFSKRLSLLINYDEMFIISGRVSDRDYLDDNRRYPSYNGHFIDNKGHSWNGLMALSYNLVNFRRLALVPYLGYCELRQHFFLLDPPGSNRGLNSSYYTRWNGSLLGTKVLWSVKSWVSIFMNIRYEQLSYHGTGDWNLIKMFRHPVSYIHYAKGYALYMALGLQVITGSHTRFILGSNYSHYITGSGTDVLYLANGKIDRTLLNEVIGGTLEMQVGYSYLF